MVNECGLPGNVQVLTPPKVHFLVMIVLVCQVWTGHKIKRGKKGGCTKCRNLEDLEVSRLVKQTCCLRLI